MTKCQGDKIEDYSDAEVTRLKITIYDDVKVTRLKIMTMQR